MSEQTAAARKTAVPEWMRPFTIGEADWMHGSKPALKVGMTPRFDLKTNVWCCGILGSHGYKGELAFTMHSDRQIPLTPALMSRQIQKRALAYYAEAGVELTEEEKKALRPSRQNMRRAMGDLETDGIGERRILEEVVIDDYLVPAGALVRELPGRVIKRLHKAKIGYYFFLLPQAPLAKPKRPGEVVRNDYFLFANCSPQESAWILRILKKYKGDSVDFKALRAKLKKVASNGYLGSPAEELIKGYFHTEEVAAKMLAEGLEVVLAGERIEIEPEIQPKTTTTARPAPSAEEPVVVVEPNSPVYDELSKHGATTLKAADQLMTDCRKIFGDATPSDVVVVIRRVAATFNGNTRNPVGVLLRTVPEYFRNYERPPEMVHPAWSPVAMRKEEAVAKLTAMLQDETEQPDSREWARSELEKLCGNVKEQARGA